MCKRYEFDDLVVHQASRFGTGSPFALSDLGFDTPTDARLYIEDVIKYMANETAIDEEYVDRCLSNGWVMTIRFTPQKKTAFIELFICSASHQVTFNLRLKLKRQPGCRYDKMIDIRERFVNWIHARLDDEFNEIF
ncbi:hypothetical protein AVT69_gp340 [Pseudomonas phage PhiPA3]|uniref:Uncharacterized protein 342 n=1 Tax=Pseudomonas phage PhiPA3 TaxID=998086 RepID=F8SJH8_BPPA3|nr:hypothetical protein AVT69_gp340 [Pseudomonas phage PhiPA3]AEH03765.1 hypothetical protein [Pseudomonas phage PhiPA3]